MQCLRAPLHRAIVVHVQPGPRLQPWIDEWFLFAGCQPSGCHHRSSICYRRPLKGRKWQFQSEYSYMKALTRCSLHILQDQQASGDCMKPWHASHHTSRRDKYIAAWGHWALQNLHTSSALVLRNPKFVDTMKAPVSYVDALDTKYGVKLIAVHIENIIHDTLSIEKLPIRMRETYVQYKRLAKRCIHDSACSSAWEIEHRKQN